MKRRPQKASSKSGNTPQVNPLKAIRITSLLLWHILYAGTGRLFQRDPKALRAFFLRAVRERSLQTVKALGIELVVEGAENARAGQNYLIVANHLSYLDVVLIGAFRETGFVTSMEMKEAPFLGLLTELGGCLYVERRSKENILNEVAELEEALKQGFNVTIFPEATSTNGAQVLPFKRPLFTAAVRATTPVLPIVIQYETLDGKPVTAENRDHLCWYGDMDFAPHFFGLTAFRHIRVRLKVLPEIPVEASSTRDTLMDKAFHEINRHYRPIQ